jgi:LPS O-antigen subunit length determinant protein (WzzB/FepE family)
MIDQNRESLTSEDIDWIDWLLKIWTQKVTVGITIAIFTVLGWVYAESDEQKYLSVIAYEQNLKVPYANFLKLKQGFVSMFNSPQTFSEWSATKDDLNIKSSDLLSVKNINGNLTTAIPDKIEISSKIKDHKWARGSITIKSDQPEVLQETFEYTNFVNNKVTRQYYNLINRIHIKASSDNSKNSLTDDGKIKVNKVSPEAVLAFIYFIEEVEEGSKIFKISPPTKPYLVSMSPRKTIILSVILGALLGLFFAHLRVFRNSKT